MHNSREKDCNCNSIIIVTYRPAYIRIFFKYMLFYRNLYPFLDQKFPALKFVTHRLSQECVDQQMFTCSVVRIGKVSEFEKG